MTQTTQDRSKRVLAALIREFIATGEPVASSLLVSAAGLGVSSATVRNILARLEDDGYVQQPHTSAGRIPTDRGYRFYVDLLLEGKRSCRTATAVEARLRRDGSGALPDFLLSRASHMVSQASGVVGFALKPQRGLGGLRPGRFHPSRCRASSSIVARGGQVCRSAFRLTSSSALTSCTRRPITGCRICRHAAVAGAPGRPRAAGTPALRCLVRAGDAAGDITFSNLSDERMRMWTARHRSSATRRCHARHPACCCRWSRRNNVSFGY